MIITYIINDMDNHNQIIHNTHYIHYLRIYFIKTFIGKIMWDKNLMKKKKVDHLIFYYVITCIIKNLVKKIQWNKIMRNEKRM